MEENSTMGNHVADGPGTLKHLNVDGVDIAVLHDQPADQPNGPGLLWLPGFKSDMEGAKAQCIAEFARARGLALTRFDYSGHGRSGGHFDAGTISRWTRETLAVFDEFCRGDVIVAGSSMGGWIALRVTQLLAARAKANAGGRKIAGAGIAEAGAMEARIAGLMLIAPAPDFTEDLMWNRQFDAASRAEILEKGKIMLANDYGPPYAITRDLIVDGRENLVLRSEIVTGCPVAILQGVRDSAVPYDHTLRLLSRLVHDDVVLASVSDGDHRLSRPGDLMQIEALLDQIIEKISDSTQK